MQKIVVTGASGFIGQHVIKHLQDRSFEVHVLSRHNTHDTDGVFVHQHDLLADNSDLPEFFKNTGASHLLHLAWCVEPGKFWQSRENLDWVSASLKLYQAFVNAGGKRIVCAGTCAEYDWNDLSADSVLQETKSPQNPSTLYGQSKLSLFRILEKAAALDEVSLAWGRIFFLYGPGEKEGRLISDAVTHLLKGQSFETTAGTQIRDFMHVQDVAGAFATLCDSDVQGAVNIGSGQAQTLAHTLQLIERETATTDLLKLGARPMPSSEPASIVADVSRLQDEVGFQPGHSLNDGIQNTIEWWRQQL